MLKVKASELEQKNKTANRPQKRVNSQEEIKAIPSKLAPIEAHQIDNKVTSANAHHLFETQSAVPSNTGCQEPPQEKTNKRCTNKRKSESCEAVKDTNTVQHNYKPHLQSSGSLHHEDPRGTLRRRSARLNPGSCEVTEVSCETLREEAVVPSAPSSFSVPKLHEPNRGKNMGKSLQNELPCDTTTLKVKASELKKNETNMQRQKEVNLEEEIQASRSTVAGVEAYQIGDEATNNNPNYSAGPQSSLPFNIEHPEPPQERRNKRKSACRGANKRKLESCEGPKDSNIEEDINAICHSSSSEPLHHEEKRKSPRRKSARLNPGSFEVIKAVFETLDEDIVAPLAPSSPNILIEQSENEKQNGCCSSMKPSEEQASGRSSFGRPSRRAAEKIVSYKEIPLNVKMRRA